ncbi:hypothetical protein [Actinacidiphila glaucinigra]|uniref:Uncharacterized protein n=1 Tax=Actinacidiphila glaucinigra TaxID=235986 RepID=A0A239MHR5_9ACTN|nr:hypothetical protein [Actinacidiphila glaucinigra]SNT42245.1 hypothetical protein SAMN05216252_124123 [Actinacidiphila glaucinigra]
MTEQTQSDDVKKIPAQAGAPAAETLPDAGPAAAPSGNDASEPVTAEAASTSDTPAEPAGPAVAEPVAESMPAEATPAEAVTPVPRKRLRDRRGLRAAARWTAAVVVFAVLGGAAAYAVTQPERTEIPGLETPDDGRWTYPALKLPKLPAGQPGAMDRDNPAGRHHADLRTLLPPVPSGAKRDTSFPDRGGWLPTADFVEIYPEGVRKKFRALLEDNTLRHVAARAWTMPDGTRTEIYLVQFATKPYTTRVRNELIVPPAFAQAAHPGTDTAWSDDDSAVPKGEMVSPYNEAAPRGATHLRAAYITAGDTLAVVHMEKRGTQSAVPFHQTVLLQAQLLG